MRRITIVMLLVTPMVFLGCDAIEGALARIFPKTYSVHSLGHVYTASSGNAEVKVKVYKQGDTGHLEEVMCHFPPDFLRDGLVRIRVGEPAMFYSNAGLLPPETAFYCDPIY